MSPPGVTVARCTACSIRLHPMRPDCTACRGATTSEQIPGTGHVVSWTRIERPPAGFPAPQRVVLVEADGPDGATVLLYAQATDDAVLQTGTRVQLHEATDATVRAEPR